MGGVLADVHIRTKQIMDVHLIICYKLYIHIQIPIAEGINTSNHYQYAWLDRYICSILATNRFD